MIGNTLNKVKISRGRWLVLFISSLIILALTLDWFELRNFIGSKGNMLKQQLQLQEQQQPQQQEYNFDPKGVIDKRDFRPYELGVIGSTTEEWDCNSKIPTTNTFSVQSNTSVADTILSTKITFVECTTVPGQLCNRMALLGAMLRRLRLNGMLNTFLAVNHVYSQAVWDLDLELLTKPIAGLMLNCEICVKSGHGFNCHYGFITLFKPEYITCNTIVIKGKIYSIAGRVFKVSGSIHSDPLWEGDRAKHVGFLEEHLLYIQPKKFMKDLMKDVVNKYRKELGPNTNLVAIHRRFMDGFCYVWVPFHTTYQCYPHPEISQHAASAGKTLDPGSNELKLYEKDHYNSMTQEFRERVESQNIYVMGCNYTLDDHQMKSLEKSFPLLLEKPFGVLLSSDGQDKLGEKALLNNKYSKKIKTLEDLEKPGCFTKDKQHYMLADMLSMSYADLHIDNVISSCGDIVAHWRRMLGKKIGTSFPQTCYDGFYERK